MSRDAKSYEEKKTVREQRGAGIGWYIGGHKRPGNHVDISGRNPPGRRQKPGWCGKAASRRSVWLEPSEWREKWLEESGPIPSLWSGVMKRAGRPDRRLLLNRDVVVAQTRTGATEGPTAVQIWYTVGRYPVWEREDTNKSWKRRELSRGNREEGEERIQV